MPTQQLFDRYRSGAIAMDGRILLLRRSQRTRGWSRLRPPAADLRPAGRACVVPLNPRRAIPGRRQPGDEPGGSRTTTPTLIRAPILILIPIPIPTTGTTTLMAAPHSRPAPRWARTRASRPRTTPSPPGTDPSTLPDGEYYDSDGNHIIVTTSSNGYTNVRESGDVEGQLLRSSRRHHPNLQQ